jgi:hypothetical protein
MRRRPRNTRNSRIGLLIAAIVLGPAVPARAQAPARKGSLELAVGGVWAGGSSLGRDEATETRNQIGGDRFTLFAASSRIDPGGGGEARLALYLTPRIAVEAGGYVARHRVATRLSSDVEGIPDVTATEDLDEFIIDGAIAIHVGAIGRFRPFVRGGVGYLRQLHQDASLVETGRAYHAGGGATVWLTARRPGFFKGWGLRGDARVIVRDGGFSVGEQRRAGVVGTGSLLLVF